MRELIKKQVTRFIMRYTCQICERTTETISGVDFASDEEALTHGASYGVNGWWVADDQEVCVMCLSKARQMLQAAGIKLVNGFLPLVKQEVKYALKHAKEFAEDALQRLEEIIHEPEDVRPGSQEAEFLADSLRRIARLRNRLTCDGGGNCGESQTA